jgi:dephospho-CoA kinase
MQRDTLTEEEVRARLSHQASDPQRAAIAHHVIKNDGEQLVIPQVIALHAQFIALSE